ncbi:hypothetical protein EV646_10315 [Kribbella antiqua]|uniref:DUF1453 domain-containing protein n=1 Tax=Kribbella antiqua TaxID=2512217 RepID=A0A4R2IXG9_9ACTN|nr:hypothetical protein [Kribbella antiqua]TCO49038.1 hypothetical protein EV646_10315 [Kribbella antiqua]
MRQALLTSAAILGYVLFTNYGRRRFTWHKWVPLLVAIPAIAVVYLRTAPATGADLLIYAAAAVLGAGFGLAATATTALDRDRATGRLFTCCGPAFAATWVIVLGSRVALVWALQDDPGFRRAAGSFMAAHAITTSAIAPTFVLLAIAMFAVRTVAILFRARQSRPRAAAFAVTP